jgi:hypothetical protein
MCCIVTDTVDERPEYFSFEFSLENEAGEYQSGYAISVRSRHGFDSQHPQPLRSVHVLPAGSLTFNAPGIYTARMTLNKVGSQEQKIVVMGDV